MFPLLVLTSFFHFIHTYFITSEKAVGLVFFFSQCQCLVLPNVQFISLKCHEVALISIQKTQIKIHKTLVLLSTICDIVLYVIKSCPALLISFRNTILVYVPSAGKDHRFVVSSFITVMLPLSLYL